jgi:hypothetical protein
MSTKVSFKASGPLHENPSKHLKIAVTKATANTAEFGRRVVQADTPVATGLLQSKWFFVHTGYSQFELSNQTFYAPYVEARFKMLQRNQPLIQKELDRNLNIEIPKALN